MTSNTDDKASGGKLSPHQPPQVYAAISAVQQDISKTGIAKDKKTSGGARFNFRGIDDVYNAISPLLAKHGLVVAPRYADREVIERKSNNGGALFYTTITGNFDFISAADGSCHTVTTFGEAMDSGDKGTNKAMAIAHKYAILQVFAIPTETTDDPDAYTHHQQPYQNHQQPIANQNMPELPAPIGCAVTNSNGKMFDANQRRIFSPDQFNTLIQSIMSGQYDKRKFMDYEKYLYSDEQAQVLRNL